MSASGVANNIVMLLSQTVAQAGEADLEEVCEVRPKVESRSN